MGFEDLTGKAQEYMGNEENHDQINSAVDAGQEHLGGALGEHGDKANEFIDGQQEERFGGGGGEGGGGPEGQGDGGQGGGEGGGGEGGGEGQNQGQ